MAEESGESGNATEPLIFKEKPTEMSTTLAQITQRVLRRKPDATSLRRKDTFVRARGSNATLDEILKTGEQEETYKAKKGIAVTPLSFMDEFELINGVPAFVMETTHGNEPTSSNEPIRNQFTCYAYSKDGTRVAAGDKAGNIHIWTTDNYRPVGKKEVASGRSVGCVRFLKDSNNTLVVSDVLGACEHISLDIELVYRWNLPSVHEIQERCFIDNDALAIAMATDPDSRSAKIWSPCASADGTVIAQAISTRIGPQSFICDTRVFISHSSQRNQETSVAVSRGRSLVSRYELSDNGHRLMVVFAAPQAHELAFMGNELEDCIEVWPKIAYGYNVDMQKQSLPAKMGRWANGGDYIIGWTSGLSALDDAVVTVWKTSTIIDYLEMKQRRRRRKPPLLHHEICPMEEDDIIYHVEMLSPSRGDDDSNKVVLAICFAEDIDADIAINIWDSEQRAFLLQFDTRTPFKETLVGRRFLSQPDVMGFYWGHNDHVMERSVTKMCISPDHKWIAFYSSECKRGYLWSLKDAIPVAKLGLPDKLADADQSIVDAMKTIAFNPSGDSLMLIGLNRMIAFVPAFLQKNRGLQMEHIHTADSKYVTYDSLGLSYDGSTLIVSGQAKATNVASFSKSFGPAFLPVTSQIDTGAKIQGVTSGMLGFSKVPKDYSLSNDGSKVGIIFVDNSVAIANVDTATWDPTLKIRRFMRDRHLTTISTSVDDIFNRVFFASLSNGTEQLVCFSLQRKGCVYWFDVTNNNYQFVSRMPLSVDQSLGIKLTDGRSKAVVLGSQTAQIIDLERRTISKTVSYYLSIPRARQLLAATSNDTTQLFFSDEDKYEVSNDGERVLIGWDLKKNKPIHLTPTTRSTKLKRFIQLADEGINTNVWLSDDARWVIYAAEPGNHTGIKKGLCINDSQGKRATRMIPDELDKTGCIPLFDISGDGRIIVQRSVFKQKKDETTLFDILLVLTPYAIEGSMPDFARLQLKKLTSNDRVVPSLISDFSWPLINYPDYEDMSLFQHALINRMSPWINAFYALGKEQNIPINLYWKDQDGVNGELVDKNALQWAINTRTAELVWDQLVRLVDQATTVRATAAIIRSSLPDLYTYFPALFMKLMESNMLIAPWGRAAVAVTVFEKEKFLVGTDSNDISWEPKPHKKVLKLWKSMGKNVEAEKTVDDRKKAEIPAEGKFVLVQDIAKIGMRGITRYLLMLDAPANVFKTEIMKWTINFKWETFGKRMLFYRLMLYLAFLAAFTTYAVLLGTKDSLHEDKSRGKLFLIPLFVSVLFSVFSLLEERRQFLQFRRDSIDAFEETKTGNAYYAKSQWNWIEMISNLLMLPLPILHILSIVGPNAAYWGHILTVLVAILGLLMWFKLLYFAQAFRASGSLVIAVRQVIVDVLVFIGLICVILFGFAVSFVVIFRHADEEESGKSNSSNVPSGSSDATNTTSMLTNAVHVTDYDVDGDDDNSNSFSDLGIALLTMFQALLGDFEIDTFKDAKHMSILAITFFVLYMLTMMITLLNLIIGVMGDSFDKVRSEEEAQFLKGRAGVIDDLEATLSDQQIKRQERKIGTFLHALEPIEERQELDVWPGKIKALEKVVQKQLESSDKHMRREMEKLSGEIKELKRFLTQNR